MARAIVKAFKDHPDFAELEHGDDGARLVTLTVSLPLRPLQSLKHCMEQIERFFPSKERPPTTDRLVTDEMPCVTHSDVAAGASTGVTLPYDETNP